MTLAANFETMPAVVDPDDAVMCLIDHQSGLFELVQDIEQSALRRHVSALSRAAYITQIPTLTTASVPDGPNGPLIPEVHGNNPDATYVARQGQINAWDMPEFVSAIEATGRRTLIIAGCLTSVCLAFPTVDALAAGYRVFAVIDASGNWTQMATDLTLARVMQAGAVPIDTYAVIAYLMKTWNQKGWNEWRDLMAELIVPKYGNLIESYDKAQQIAKDGPETVLDQW